MTNLTVDPQPESAIFEQPISTVRASHNFPKAILIIILVFVLLALTAYGAYWYTKNYLLIPLSRPTISNVPSETSQPNAARELSTPGLIEQAYSEGEITAEQRLLYLAYAVYDFSVLPTHFHSNVGWRGTSTVEELYATVATRNVMCKFSSATQAELRRLFPKAVKC